MIVFVPDTVTRTLAAWQKSVAGGAWTVQRRGLLRTIVSASFARGDEMLQLVPLSSGELSAELRARSDDVELREVLAAFHVRGEGPAEELASAVGGWLRKTDTSPVLRGLALCALVARVQAEDDDYEGLEEEPARLLGWLMRHGAEIALSEEERAWLEAPIGSLPLVARYASLPDRLATHAFALGIVADPETAQLPELMNGFGFLADELPVGLASRRIRPGREQFLG